MDKLKFMSFLAMLSLASGATAYAQEQAPAQAPELQATEQTQTSATPRILGMTVESPTGEKLGSVIDVVANEQGDPVYAVISTGADTATAVPYTAVSPMVRNNKLVFDRMRLQNSPQVAQSDLQDRSNAKWRLQADRYWGAATIRSASPGRTPTPVDR